MCRRLTTWTTPRSRSAKSLGRFLVEVTPSNAARFEESMASCPTAHAGTVLAAPEVRLVNAAGVPVILTSLDHVGRSWARVILSKRAALCQKPAAQRTASIGR